VSWGLTTSTLTFVHVLLSLVGIGSGFVVMAGLLGRAPLAEWTALFLITTVATSVTGFAFPVDRLLPSHMLGALSLVVLAVANVFVGVVQAFLKVPLLRSMAPRQTEPPFLLAQGVVLALFVLITVAAARRFRGTLVV
jgi:hypothetical protein